MSTIELVLLSLVLYTGKARSISKSRVGNSDGDGNGDGDGKSVGVSNARHRPAVHVN